MGWDVNGMGWSDAPVRLLQWVGGGCGGGLLLLVLPKLGSVRWESLPVGLIGPLRMLLR